MIFYRERKNCGLNNGIQIPGKYYDHEKYFAHNTIHQSKLLLLLDTAATTERKIRQETQPYMGHYPQLQHYLAAAGQKQDFSDAFSTRKSKLV